MMKNLKGSQVSLEPSQRLQLPPDTKTLWFLYQLARFSCAYNIILAVRICSQIDAIALEGAWQSLLPDNSPIELLRGIIQTIKADELAFWNYVPEVGYTGRITLLRTSKLSEELAMKGELPADDTWGWSRFSSLPVDVHILPGNHTTILKEPHVQVLASTLKFCLEQSEHDLWYKVRAE